MYKFSFFGNNIIGGYDMENNINTLDELNKGCCMGMTDIENILMMIYMRLQLWKR